MADPLYRRIAEDLRQQITSGRLKPGSQLPGEEKLRQRFDASRNTIRDAVKFLIALGLVETRAGQGTFVTTPPVPLVTTLTADRQDRQEQPTSDPESTDGLAPWSLQTSFYPRSLATQGAERLFDATDITQGTVKYLEETLGIKQTGYRDWITVRAPDPNEMSFFQLPSDGRVPVFEIFRTAFDQNGKPMRVTVTIFPADRNQFSIDVGDVPARQYKAAE